MNFECKNCGECCKQFGKYKCLPLWEWEIKTLKERAKEKNIVLNIQPFEMSFDKRSNLSFIVNYALVQEPCPFLEDNKCSIYEDRPLVCKLFPSIKSHLVLKGEMNLSSFGACPNFDAKRFLSKMASSGEGFEKRFNKKDVIDNYTETFGDNFIYSFQRDMIEKTINDIIQKQIQNKKIKLRKISKFDYHKYNPLPFLEFLIKIKVLDEKGKAEFISSVKDNKKAKEMIEYARKKFSLQKG